MLFFYCNFSHTHEHENVGQSWPDIIKNDCFLCFCFMYLCFIAFFVVYYKSVVYINHKFSLLWPTLTNVGFKKKKHFSWTDNHTDDSHTLIQNDDEPIPSISNQIWTTQELHKYILLSKKQMQKLKYFIRKRTY